VALDLKADGRNYSQHAGKFKDADFICISELDGDLGVDKLSDRLGITLGTMSLIVKHAKAEIRRLRREEEIANAGPRRQGR
jgi:hypothetical protein